MADRISPMIEALLKKLPDFDPNQDFSLNDYLKMMGLEFDETTLKYRMNFTLDSTLSDSEILILVSVILKRHVNLQDGTKTIKVKIEELEEQKQNLEEEIHRLEETVPVEQLQDDNKETEDEVTNSQELMFELQTDKTEIENDILTLKKLIPPEPVSVETSHCLTVTSLKEAHWYRLGRVQRRSIKSRLELIAREEGCTYEEIERRTKIFFDIPNSIVTAGHLREYLRKCGEEVKGEFQKIMFHGGDDALYDHVNSFIHR